MTKKIYIFFVTSLFAFFSLSANAALQWKLGAFIGTVSTGIAIGFGLIGAAPIVVAGTLAVGVHAAVIALYWDEIGQSPPISGSGVASRGLSVIIDPNTPLVTPAGWTQGTVGDKEPTAQLTRALKTEHSLITPTASTAPCSGVRVGASCEYKSSSLNNLADIISTDRCSYYGTCDLYYQHQPNEPYYKFLVRGVDVGGGIIQTVQVSEVAVTDATCDLGYSLTGIYSISSCILTNSALVVKPSDEVCEVRPIAGVFKKMKNDPDCDNSAIAGIGTSTMTALATNNAVYFATSANNTVTVYEKTYNSTSNNTSLTTVNFNPSSDVDFIQTANSLGNTVTVNPITSGTGTGTTTGTSDAKDSSLNVVDGGDEPVGSGDTSGVSSPSDGLKTSFNPLKNWRPPASIGSCPTAVFDLFARTYTLDSHCTIFNNNSVVISQAMGVVFSISALFIVLAA
jgi:hypothetical protein